MSGNVDNKNFQQPDLDVTQQGTADAKTTQENWDRDAASTPGSLSPTSTMTASDTSKTNKATLAAKTNENSKSGLLNKFLDKLPTGEHVKGFFGAIAKPFQNAGKALSQMATNYKNSREDTKETTTANPIFTKTFAQSPDASSKAAPTTTAHAPQRPPRPLVDAVRSGDVGAVKALMASGTADTIRDLDAAKALANKTPETSVKMLKALKRDLPPPPRPNVKSDVRPKPASTTTATTTTGTRAPPRPLLDAVRRGDVETVKALMADNKNQAAIERDLKVAPGFARQLRGNKSSEMLAALNIRKMPEPPPPLPPPPDANFPDDDNSPPPPLPPRDD